MSAFKGYIETMDIPEDDRQVCLRDELAARRQSFFLELDHNWQAILVVTLLLLILAGLLAGWLVAPLVGL